jgi:hypothetical protein
MVNEINSYLKIFVTENQIPLQQILTERDIHQLSVTIAAIAANPETTEFNSISDTIFKPLKEKGTKAVLHSINENLLTNLTTKEEEETSLAVLAYYCLLYFKLQYDLPVEKILFVVNTYMNNHRIKNKDTHKINVNNPVSNLVRIDPEHYVKYNGKVILPPNDDIKKEFIAQLTNLLIK